MKCINCNINDAIKYSKYSNGLFCCKKCACSYSTKNKRYEINEKVSKSLYGRGHGDVKLVCKICNSEFIVNWKYRNQKCCSIKCSSKYRLNNTDCLENLSKSLKQFYIDPERRKRLRDIGRKGGFGNKGYINGIYYASNIEKECFNYLINENINFIPHKNILDGSYISDIYIPDIDLWIEIDGINREKRKEYLGDNYLYWINKLNYYKNNNLNFLIIYNLNELIYFINNEYKNVDITQR